MMAKGFRYRWDFQNYKGKTYLTYWDLIRGNDVVIRITEDNQAILETYNEGEIESEHLIDLVSYLRTWLAESEDTP